VTLIKDALYALRMFARKPGFTAIAVVTLGLGIGMSVAVWTLVDAVLIDSLPYPDADRLLQIRRSEPGRIPRGAPMSAFDYRDLAERNQTLEAVAATFAENVNLTGGSSPERVAGSWVSAPFFEVVGIAPDLGRGFRASDDAFGGDLVAVLSHGLWQRRFNGDPEVLGDSVMVNGRPHVVVGVAPEGFSFPGDTELWLPIAFDWENEDRGHGWLTVYGRIRQGLTLEAARSDLDRLADQLRVEQPDLNEDRGFRVVQVKRDIVGPITPSLLVLLASVTCVLLIAAANVTILVSVRAVARQREVALRQALGARRGQLVRQLMVESVLLALAGGVVGLVLAHWSVRIVRARFVDLIPRSEGAGIDLGVLVFALLVSVATGLLVGLVPAIRSREDRILARLREAERSVAGRGPAVGTALVVAEITLAVVLLAGAVLLIRTFVNLLQVDPGFDSQKVLIGEVALTSERYASSSDLLDFYDRSLEEIAAIPGVAAVGTIYPLPLHGRQVTTSVDVEGVPRAGSLSLQPLVSLRFASPGYLEAAGLWLVAGRFLEPSDTADAPSVAVVNQSFVRELMPGGEPVGRRITGEDPNDPDAQWGTIVGVVEDVRHRYLADEAGPEMYLPVAQVVFDWAVFVVRSEQGSAVELATPLQEAVHRIDPELPVFNVQPWTEIVSRSLARTRFVTAILVLFAATGLALSGVGVFSVVSYSVGQRVREMAIRMALGGSHRAVVTLVMRQGLTPVLAGMGLGLVASLLAMRLLSSRLYGIDAHDPSTHIGTALLILAIAALATLVPARRATRVEPMTVLRAE
jgi:putative ABC transport system permease protein